MGMQFITALISPDHEQATTSNTHVTTSFPLWLWIWLLPGPQTLGVDSPQWWLTQIPLWARNPTWAGHCARAAVPQNGAQTGQNEPKTAQKGPKQSWGASLGPRAGSVMLGGPLDTHFAPLGPRSTHYAPSMAHLAPFWAPSGVRSVRT